MANNRRKVIHKTGYDLLYNKQVKSVSPTKSQETVAEIQSMFKEIFAPQTYVAYGSNNDIITSPMRYFKKTEATDRTAIDKAIDNLRKNKFFDIVTGKTQEGSTLINKTIDLNNKLNFSNQKVKANASLTSVKEAYNNLQEIIKNKGKFHVYDLETIGGNTREGVWSPIGITEFSAHTNDFATNTVNKTDVFLGMDKKQRKELQEKIFKAIDNGTLEADGDLAVTAMRMSMYGNTKTKIEKNDKGFYEVVSFVDSESAQRTNKNLIKKGFDLHEKAYYDTDKIDGIKASEKAVLDKISEIQKDLTNKTGMLGGFNHTKFDDPITNKYLSDIVVKNKELALTGTTEEKKGALATLSYYNKLFDIDNGGKAVLSPGANQTFDMRAAVDLYKGYFGIDALYAGQKDAYTGIGPQMARQEHIAGAHFPTKMASGNAHQASFDVEMLSEMFLGKSEITGQNFLDYLMNGNGEKNKGINSIDEINKKLSVGDQLFKAKATPAGASFTSQGHLNFVHDRKRNQFLTADGYVLGKGKQERMGFDLGAKVNKNQFYTIGGIQKIDATSEWGEMMSQVLPELSAQDIFSLRLDIQTTDKYKSTALGDTSRYFFFKSEGELESFVSSNLNMIAEKGESGAWQILRDNDLVQKELEINKLHVNSKGQAEMALDKDFWKMSDQEIIEKNINLSTERLLASRSENAVMGSNSFKKTNQLLKVQTAVEKKLGAITGLELSQIMSGEVVSGNILGKIDDKGLSELQKEIVRVAGYKGKMLPTTQTSLAIAYDTISQQSEALKTIYNQLGESKKIAGLNTEGKQIVFDSVLKNLKMEHATQYYGDDPAKIRNAVLNNKEALMSTSEIMNYFEVNLKGFNIGDKPTVLDMAKPEATKDLFRVNLESGKEYELINKLLKAKYGETDIASSKKDTYALDVLSDFMKNLDAQSPTRGKNVAQYSGIRRLEKEIDAVRNGKAELNPYEFSTRLLAELRGIKKANPVAGILNTNTTMAALIDTDVDLIKDFNEYIDKDKVQQAIKNAPNVLNLKTEKDIQKYVNNNLIKHYMPNKSDFLNAGTKKNSAQLQALEELYNTTKKGHVKNLTEVLTAATKAGTGISVQEDGTLMLMQGGEYAVLDRIAKTKLHKDSGVLYHQVGLQKVVAHNKVSMSTGGVSLTSNLEDINRATGNIVKTIERKYQNGTLKLSDIEYTQSRIAKELIENSSLQSFNIHDTKSNYRLDFSDIKNILPDLFNPNGKLRGKMEHLDAKGGFRDRNLIATMEKLLNGKTELDDLAPAMKHNLLKNVQDIVLALANEDDTTLIDIVKNSNFSAKENQTADLVGHIGNRYQGSTLTAFDNNARPTIAQSGRGYYVRSKDVDSAIKENADKVLFKGSLFTTDTVKDEMFRNIDGVGEALTNVSFRRRFVGSNSLKVILDTKFDEVINNAKVENMTQNQIAKLYGQLYDSINTFEQEKHMDTRVFESVYGRSADIQRLSVGADIMKPIESKVKLNQEEVENYKNLLGMIGDITLDGDNLVYKKNTGRLVQKGDKMIEYASFGDTSKMWTNKIHNGVLNYGFFSTSSGLKLNEEEISNIINQNKSAFIDKEGKLLDETKLRSKLINLFDSKGFTSQYFVEDVNRLSYAKLMDDEVEKGMTKLDYVKLGSINKNIAKVFEDLGLKRFVGNNVLTDEAFDAAMASNSDVGKILQKYGFSDTQTLKQAIYAERHAKSVITYDHIFKGATELANDALAKHGNKGSMLQGAFSELVMSTANHKYGNTGDEARQNALSYILDFANKDSRYSFLEEFELGKKVSKKKLDLKAENGYIKMLEDFATGSNKFHNINNEALENLIVDIDKELGFEGTNKLVHDNVTLLKDYKDGKFEYETGQRYIGRAQFGNVETNTTRGYEKLSNVLLSTESIVSGRIMEDPETQTGISQAYFDRKLEIVKLKKKYAETGDSNYLMEIKKAEADLAGVSDIVKQMGISDQEISIMEMSELNSASERVLNKLKDNEYLKSDVFNGMIVKEEDGSLALRKDLKNKKLLGNFTSQYKDMVLYDHTNEIELTPELLMKPEYAHLQEQYDLAHIKGRKIGVESAEKFHNLNMANMAYEFDSSNAKLRDPNKLLDKGFEYMNINEFVSNHGRKSDIIDSIANKHLLIDLGEDFDASRYIALPGLGSLIGDSEVKADYQKKLTALSNDMVDYNHKVNNKDMDAQEVQDAWQRVMNKSEEIKDLVSNIYKKNGVMHSSSKILAPTPSYRLKASGADGIYENGALKAAGDETSELLETWGVKNQTALSTAQINGKSLSQWEQEGKYFDYKFMSKDQFRSMGYFDEEYMSKLGIKSETEMIDYLKQHGTLDISDRYPNIMSTSMITTRAYLDDTLASNQAKISRVTTLKYNGDFDGDSTSAHLLRVRATGEDGVSMYEDYAQYNMARLKAQEALGSGASEDDIRHLATTSSKVKVNETTYDEFRAIDLGMAIDAVDTNQPWARKVEETMAKDSIKTAKNLDVQNIAAVEGGESILSKNQFTQLSEVVDLKTFNANEQAVNEGLELLAKAKGEEVKGIREMSGDVGKNLDNALTEFSSLVKDGKLEQEAFDKFEADAIMRYRIEKYDQELMSKGSKGVIGAMNISLNATKLASSSVYGGNGPDRDMFKNQLIWEVNRLKEQDPISGKKLTLGYDENRISEYAEISNALFSKDKSKLMESKENMRNWMDKYIGDRDALVAFYDNNAGRYINDSDHKVVMSSSDVDTAKYKYIRDRYIDSVGELSKNDMAQSYLDMYGSMGKGGDRYFKRRGAAMAASNQDSMTGIAMSQIKSDFVERGMEESTLYTSKREAINRAKQSHLVADENPASQSLKKSISGMGDVAIQAGQGLGHTLNSISGSGLAMAALGTAAGLLLSGYAAGNPLNEANPETITQNSTTPKSIPQFLDEQGGYVTGDSQRGYIINIKADSKRGRKHMEKAMKQAAEASVGGAVSVNMNIRNSNNNGISDRDIEKYIENHI